MDTEGRLQDFLCPECGDKLITASQLQINSHEQGHVRRNERHDNKIFKFIIRASNIHKKIIIEGLNAGLTNEGDAACVLEIAKMLQVEDARK